MHHEVIDGLGKIRRPTSPELTEEVSQVSSSLERVWIVCELSHLS